ncbi:hypothetical protein SK128_018308, partial [Halocaridina rubra]
ATWCTTLRLPGEELLYHDPVSSIPQPPIPTNTLTLPLSDTLWTIRSRSFHMPSPQHKSDTESNRDSSDNKYCPIFRCVQFSCLPSL